MKLDADEKELLESAERGEWKSAHGGKRARARYSRYAKATFRKDRRLNIRLSSKDLEAIQRRALAEGLPYQTLISSLLHKYHPDVSKRSKSSLAVSRPYVLIHRLMVSGLLWRTGLGLPIGCLACRCFVAVDISDGGPNNDRGSVISRAPRLLGKAWPLSKIVHYLAAVVSCDQGKEGPFHHHTRFQA